MEDGVLEEEREKSAEETGSVTQTQLGTQDGQLTVAESERHINVFLYIYTYIYWICVCFLLSNSLCLFDLKQVALHPAVKHRAGRQVTIS